jgi:hypothetical protein
MVARFLDQAPKLFYKSLNLRLVLGKIDARGIELVLGVLSTLGIAMVLTCGASQNRHTIRSSSEKVISARYRPQRIDYSFMNILEDAREIGEPEQKVSKESEAIKILDSIVSSSPSGSWWTSGVSILFV